MHTARLHEGNDGRVRQVCGLRICSVMNGPKNNYMACLLNSRKIVTSAHGPVHMVSRGVRLSSSKEEIQGKSCTPEMARDQDSFQNKRERKLYQSD